MHCMDVPWRVVLNECIELAKEFGGTDGHKYVNAVLGGLAPKLRAAEVANDQGRPASHAKPAAKATPAEPEPSQAPDAEPAA
jgi:N utilization substance protein B